MPSFPTFVYLRSPTKKGVGSPSYPTYVVVFEKPFYKRYENYFATPCRNVE